MNSMFPALRRGVSRVRAWAGQARRRRTQRALAATARRVNLCAGAQRVEGYVGVDIDGVADLVVDLSRENLPFADDQLEAVVCMSAINYFTRARAQELVREVWRVLRRGGVARFGVQDMRLLATRYVEEDETFFFQKLPSGQDRFPGATLGDKFAGWFYGFPTAGGPCRYFYDFESLAYLFRTAGFSLVERRGYRDSRLREAPELDNRPEQMFFLEAVK